MPSVQLSPNRFIALDLCSPVALTFPDVLDLSNHLHRRGGSAHFRGMHCCGGFPGTPPGPFSARWNGHGDTHTGDQNSARINYKLQSALHYNHKYKTYNNAHN